MDGNLIPYEDFLIRRLSAFSKEDLVRFIKEKVPFEEEQLLRSRQKEILEVLAIELETGFAGSTDRADGGADG